MKRKLKRKEIRLLLKEANTSAVTLAVLVRCAHYPGNQYALMSVETAIAHCLTCRPDRITTSITEMELVAAASNGKGR